LGGGWGPKKRGRVKMGERGGERRRERSWVVSPKGQKERQGEKRKREWDGHI